MEWGIPLFDFCCTHLDTAPGQEHSSVAGTFSPKWSEYILVSKFCRKYGSTMCTVQISYSTNGYESYGWMMGCYDSLVSYDLCVTNCHNWLHVTVFKLVILCWFWKYFFKCLGRWAKAQCSQIGTCVDCTPPPPPQRGRSCGHVNDALMICVLAIFSTTNTKLTEACSWRFVALPY